MIAATTETEMVFRRGDRPSLDVALCTRASSRATVMMAVA